MKTKRTAEHGVVPKQPPRTHTKQPYHSEGKEGKLHGEWEIGRLNQTSGNDQHPMRDNTRSKTY